MHETGAMHSGVKKVLKENSLQQLKIGHVLKIKGYATITGVYHTFSYSVIVLIQFFVF